MLCEGGSARALGRLLHAQEAPGHPAAQGQWRDTRHWRELGTGHTQAGDRPPSWPPASGRLDSYTEMRSFAVNHTPYLQVIPITKPW